MYSPVKFLDMTSFRFHGDGTTVAREVVATKNISAAGAERVSSDKSVGYLGGLFRALRTLFKLAADTSLAVGTPRRGEGIKWWR
jgi:hypothetical protein